MPSVSQSKKPRVLMVGTDPKSKGGVSSVIRMYREGGLFRRAHYLSSYTDGGGLQKMLYFAGFWLAYLRLLVLNPEIQLVHIHSASYSSFARKSIIARVSKLLGKKVIFHIHGAEFALFHQRSKGLKRWWIESTLAKCEAIIALSTQWKKDLGNIVPSADVRVIYNPTIMKDVSFEQGLPHQIAQGHCANKEEAVKFLFMGRIGKRKGVYDIVESMRQTRPSNVQIDIYGDGEVEQLQQLVNEKGLQNTINVRGWIDGSQKDATFRSANVLLLPSYNEGLPISVLEAMAYGLPVLATDVGGIAEAVQDGRNGFLIHPGECDALAERIERLAESAQLREEMGRAGYELAASRFSLPVIIGQLERLYDEFTHA